MYWLQREACEILVLQPGIKLTAPALSLNQWTARKVCSDILFFFKLQTSGTITALRDHLHHYTDGTYFSQYFIKIVYLTMVNQEY